MSKAYICDACGLTITNPHDVKMREFYVGMDFDFELGLVFPRNIKTCKSKVHLCDECFHALREIAERNAASTKKSDLMPCPFCGGEARVNVLDFGSDNETTFCVQCTDCLAEGSENYSKEIAIETWNRRI